MSHTLPELGFATDALEPQIDKATMEIHHGKHHNAYVSKLNDALEGESDEVKGMHICELIRNLDKVSDAKRGAVRNNGGGHFNHSLFWMTLKPGGASAPSGDLAKAIDAKFGSFEKFKEEFANAGATRFGSGWAWLGVKSDGSVAVTSTPNQDSPPMGAAADTCGHDVILGLDVWEHAYYLNYQNRRPDYISAFWDVVNWDVVAKLYAKATGSSESDSCCKG